jgi:large subunit ribosomal protein L6
MSRVGNKPVQLPKGVTIEQANGAVKVKGPKGQLEQAIPPRIEIEINGGSAQVTRTRENKQSRAYHGLMRALLQNMVTGVNAGWSKHLQIQGVGYSADVEGQLLTMRLGYSHPVEYTVPDDIKVEVEKNTKITVTGIDRAAVGHVSAVIRGFRKPDAYKGKGVRYAGEQIKLKPGKAGVT